MPDRLNIILLIAEDTGRHQGCYGDPLRLTPRIDALAAEGCRFTRAFSHAPVCSASRSGIVTGQYPTRLGTLHHRSNLLQPSPLFTHALREAGYRAWWPGKTDFNFTPSAGWRDSDQDWVADLAAGRMTEPFFAFENMGMTHESGMWPPDVDAEGNVPQPSDPAFDALAPTIDPATVPVPPYLPDTPEVRADIARYYHRLAVQDRVVGRVLDALDASGQRNRTMVIYMSDHGRGLPREKRWLYEAGIHLPLIIRAPGLIDPGTVREDLVAWVDIAPTLLSLAGVPIPPAYDGQVFLGPAQAAPRTYAWLARDRMDETEDTVRGVRDDRYLYLRNLHPQRPYAQRNHYMEYMPTMRVLRERAAAGRLDGPAALFMSDTKPPEELYDTQADPHCVHNLASDPACDSHLARLRDALERWLARTGDLGLQPERALIDAGLIDDLRDRLVRKYAVPAVQDAAR